MFLLDTNVVSELRRPKPHGAVLQWVAALADNELQISAVTVGEIQAGMEITRQQNQDKAVELERWLNEVAATYNVISIDAAIFREWARLMHGVSNTLYEDAMIAATARVHKLTVATRNISDFKQFGVPVFNPFVSPGI